ncbi:hypothetical protein EDB89DRAFT_2230574 [Lactarius sanguifluus]|nr:hypothetical protein EDB89DRAFT_2230574 [Lactarius sanguifluus]
MDSNQANYQRQAIDAQIKSLEGSIRTLKLHRNALAPISSLPTEVITTIFSSLHLGFTFPTLKLIDDPESGGLAWLRVAHVCHRWREIALNQPLFWGHVDFNTVSSAGAAEILARAKTVPLHLVARVPSNLWNGARFSAFQKELQARVSHICHLRISAEPFRLHRIFEGLVSPAPTLKFLSLFSEAYLDRTLGVQVFVPDTLFDGSTPRLSRLELWNCDISWNSPLIKGLQHLEIGTPFERPSLSVWLDALDEMPQLKTLILIWASPIASPGISIPFGVERTVTLPSLTLFKISSPARDCGLALAHLILPALTSLRLIVEACHWDCTDVREILSNVSRHAHGPQDAHPLQSVLFRNDIFCAEILAWTLPHIDTEFPNQHILGDSTPSARVAFSVINEHWSAGTDAGTFDEVMEALPLEGLVTLTAENRTNVLNKQFWLRHTPKWPLLQRVRLMPAAARGFREMLLEDRMEDHGGRESPLLPSLTKLILIDTPLVGAGLSTRRTLRLCDALMRRVELGVPLETLDLRKCLATSRAVELLSEIVVDVLGPKETLKTKAQMLSMAGSRGILDESGNGPRIEGYGEGDPDTSTGSDNEAQDDWEIEDGYDEAVNW